MGGQARMSLAVAVTGVFAALTSPYANADGQSPSYLLGKQAIDEQFYAFHIQLHDDGTLDVYCKSLLQDSLRTGKILQVDSVTDYMNGCLDEARAVSASR